MKLDLEDFRGIIMELDEHENEDEDLGFSDKKVLKEYEKLFGRLPSKVSEWKLYKEYISKFQLPSDFLVQEEVCEVIDKQVLFQFIASMVDHSIRFEITDKDEVVVIFYYTDGNPRFEGKLSEIDVDGAKFYYLAFLINHLKKELEYAKNDESQKKANELKEEHITLFQEERVPMLDLMKKVATLMKIVRKEVEIAKKELPF